ncbi:MAG: type II 3-dehydroquinate dehydratase [Chloroflexi bacterium]|nr:type II 3-dehydroquinate dehydratase [Chloroflexota bacterium]
MKFLVINGPNLNLLGTRDPALYGNLTLEQIENTLRRRAARLKAELEFLQSNSEGTLIDFIQQKAPESSGIIINPGALTHYGYSLRDALADTGLPVVEVHLSNIYAREGWRAHSVMAAVARGQVSGLGWRGYLYALEFLVAQVSRRRRQ